MNGTACRGGEDVVVAPVRETQTLTFSFLGTSPQTKHRLSAPLTHATNFSTHTQQYSRTDFHTRKHTHTLTHTHLIECGVANSDGPGILGRCGQMLDLVDFRAQH